MAAVTPTRATDRKLLLKEVLDWMLKHGLLDAAAAAKVSLAARHAGRPSTSHPIIVIGEARLRRAKAPGSPLTAQAITEWLGERLRMPFYHIDPLKIDLKSVTAVMSSDYAKQRGILPGGVSGKDVTIAGSQAFLKNRGSELLSMLRVHIQRVHFKP